MGLAGRKVKQRIGNDPRNLSWADDANKFGAAYLQKLGWSAGTGLGVNGDGRTSHIKVSHKLDMLGIGAAHQKDPNGIAWKQNKDFENLLKRLNNTGGSEDGDNPGTKVDGFSRAGAAQEETVKKVEGAKEETDSEEGSSQSGKEGRKRKRTTERGAEEPGKPSKKAKKKGEKEKKSKNREVEEAESSGVATPVETPSVTASSQAAVPAPLRRAHRARFMAAKRLALNAGSAMDEILGISRSGSATPFPMTSLPETTTDTPSEDTTLQELTTSSQSVMDYFKQKLLEKSKPSTPISSTPVPALSRQPERADEEAGHDERPMGIGLGFRSNAKAEQSEDPVERRGLGIASRFGNMFSPAAASSGKEGGKETEGKAEGIAEQGSVEAGAKDKRKRKEGKKERKKKKVGKKREGEEVECGEDAATPASPEQPNSSIEPPEETQTKTKKLKRKTETPSGEPDEPFKKRKKGEKKRRKVEGG